MGESSGSELIAAIAVRHRHTSRTANDSLEKILASHMHLCFRACEVKIIRAVHRTEGM